MIITKSPDEIAHILKSGGVIAYPTEAVWGIGCDPFNEKAVQKVLRLKSRPIEKGMILIAGHPQHLQPWCHTLSPTLSNKLISPCSPPTTWIVEDKNIAPPWIRGRFHSTAIRLSQHSGVQALCAAFNGAIVSTSANPSTKKPATSLDDVLVYFSNELDAIFDQPLGSEKQPSQIKNLKNENVIRN